MRTAIIINPSSGSLKRRSTARETRLECARRCADVCGVQAEIVATASAGHAAELSARLLADGHDRIVVWGGDGTVNEAAGPLFGSSAVLGIIPGGSGDGLARALKLPRDPDAAIRLALTGTPRAIDVGWLAGRHFLCIGGVGFDAEVARRFNARKDRGLRGYVVEGLRTVWSYRCAEYQVVAGGRRFSGPRFLIAFANSRQYGNGLVIAPEANLSDGQLDVTLVSGGSPTRQLWRARRLFFRKMKTAEGVWRARLAEAEVMGTNLRCHVDGETFDTAGAAEVRITPRALNVVAAAE